MSSGGQQARHRVVIIGGGFGGLFAAKFLKRAPVDVTLVDRTNHHLFQPLLYQCATGILSEGAIPRRCEKCFASTTTCRSSSPTSLRSTWSSGA
jgi:NADH dehydrogenase